MTDEERISLLASRLLNAGYYAEGGSIHIKPSHRGRLTELKARTGKTESELYNDGNPAHKKMVVFARNARKWKHADGGYIRRMDEGTPGQLMLAYPGVSWGAFQEGIESAARSLRGDKQYKDTAPSVLPGSRKSDDAVALQTILQDRGYDIGTEAPDGYFGKNSTKALQRMLVDAGYDLGTSGSEGNGVDGIVGSKTRAAYEQWLGSGAWIGKQRRTGVVRDTAVVQKPDTVQSPRTVYNPAENQADSVVYSGPYNYGQHYDERFSNYVTSTGLDLSNISTEGVADNSKVDTFSPYIFDTLAQCNKESARNTLECASHITYMNLDDKRGFNIDTNGLRGNAWTMGDNMVKAGGQRLFDIFANEGAPSGDWDDSNKQKTIAFVREKAKDPEYISFLESSLQPGDVVELLYPNSTNFKKAYTETGGKHQNTHIGYVVKVGDELYIRDNVGNHTANTSRVHTRKLSSVLNGKEGDGVLITGAVRTKDALDGQQYIGGRQGRDMSAFGITPTATDNASQSRLSNDAAYRAMGAVYKNREKILSDNNLTVDEFNRLAGLTQAVIFKETAAGELFHNQKWISKNAGLDGVVNDTNRKELNKANTVGYTVGTPIAYLASDLTGGAISGINAHLEPSAGLGSVKYQGPASSLTDKQRRQLGSSAEVKAALRSAQPEVSGVTTLYALSTSMHAVKDLLRRYAPADIASNDDIVDQLTALAHNQGTSLIEQTLKNAKADGDWEGHMNGLLDASYGKNAMIVRGYNKTNMFSDEERAAIDQRRKEQVKSLRDSLMSRGITAQDIASMMAQRESTYTSRLSYIPQQLAQVD